MFFVYVLQSQKNGRYYIGSTKNVEQRLIQHNAGMTQATQSLRPWKLVHTQSYETLALARRREKQLKSWKNGAYLQQALGLVG